MKTYRRYLEFFIPRCVWFGLGVDVTVTAAEVIPISGVNWTRRDGKFGATVTAGQLCYSDGSDNGDFKLADCDASAATANAVGIAMCGGADGQPAVLATAGDIDPGFTVTVGEIYVASGTAGGIAPEADLAQNDYVFIVGVGITAARLHLLMYYSGVLVP